VIAVLAAGGAFVFPATARMLVTADEWTLVSSRQRITAGKLEMQLYNRGEDGHDLAAGRRGPSGRYRLWCDLPGHRAAGMRASLRVRGSP
jgi:hypothetical protein